MAHSNSVPERVGPTEEVSGRTLDASRKKTAGRFGHTFIDLVKRVWNRADTDDCTDMAAQVSFFFVLSLFPFFLVLAAIVGWLPSTNIWEDFVHWIIAYFPRLSRSLLFSIIVDLTRGHTGFFSLGVITALWSSSSGFVSLAEALSRVFGARDARAYWKKRVIGVGATVGAALFFLLSFAVWSAGHDILRIFVPSPNSGATSEEFGLKMFSWVVSVLLLFLGIDLLNYFLPVVKRTWRWLSPGTVFICASFVVGSISLNFYVRHSPSIPRVYGTLAGFIILMTWIYLATLILLIGAETDAALDEWKARGALA